MKSKQNQKSGDNSQQVQVGTLIINGTLTEQRVREIAIETSKQVISGNTLEAEFLARNRIERFTNQLIPRIQKIEDNFQSFTDPSFQKILKKAQLVAACTERDIDYKILAELLAHRVKNKTDIKKKASISKAIEIVDQIDDDSLLALTLFLMMEHYFPASGKIHEGLKAINDLYEKIDLNALPFDSTWMDNLSILGAITISSMGRLKSFEEFFTELLPGYVCAGIQKGSEDHLKAIEMMRSLEIDQKVLEDNVLIDGYVRLSIPDKKAIENITFKEYVEINGNKALINKPITKNQIECLDKIFDMYSKKEIKTVKNNFNNLLHSFSSINKAIKWWNSIPRLIMLTSIGKVIGHTNAKSINPSLPNLD